MEYSSRSSRDGGGGVSITQETFSEVNRDDSDVELSQISSFYDHLLEIEPTYARLMMLRKKNPLGDNHFQKQRQQADSGKKAALFYRMMKEIGNEMQKTTCALRDPNVATEDFKILDLCMAPGGYTASALKFNPGATTVGITLPLDQGGHKVIFRSPQSKVVYHDITMFAREFGVESVPTTHPDHSSFSNERPFLSQKFNLVFSDGQVLRTHERAEYRQVQEATRLTLSQLIFAMQRIGQGGTFIMLLHKVEAWDTMELLYRFSQFAEIELFKPVKKHVIRSTFYLVAKNVQPESESGRDAVRAWKEGWSLATFGGDDGLGSSKIRADEVHVEEVIDQFGKRLADLARPIWEIQANGLSRMDFVR